MLKKKNVKTFLKYYIKKILWLPFVIYHLITIPYGIKVLHNLGLQKEMNIIASEMFYVGFVIVVSGFGKLVEYGRSFTL